MPSDRNRTYSVHRIHFPRGRNPQTCQNACGSSHWHGSAGARGEPPCFAYTASPLPVAPINCMAKPLQNSIKIILPHLKDCQVASFPVLIYFIQNLALLTFSAPAGCD